MRAAGLQRGGNAERRGRALDRASGIHRRCRELIRAEECSVQPGLDHAHATRPVADVHRGRGRRAGIGAAVPHVAVMEAVIVGEEVRLAAGNRRAAEGAGLAGGGPGTVVETGLRFGGLVLVHPVAERGQADVRRACELVVREKAARGCGGGCDRLAVPGHRGGAGGPHLQRVRRGGVTGEVHGRAVHARGAEEAGATDDDRPGGGVEPPEAFR